jgi:hypothetical protein
VDDDEGLLRLDLKFKGAAPGLHFLVIPSGEYQVKYNAPIYDFCEGDSKRIDQHTIHCSPALGSGLSSLEFRAGGLAAVDGPNIRQIDDSFDGLEPSTATAIEGVLADAERVGIPVGTVRLWIPIKPIPLVRSAERTYGALAPLAAHNVADFGVGQVLKPLPPQYVDRSGPLVESLTGTPVVDLLLTNLRVAVSDDVPYGAITYSQPATESETQLVWTDIALCTEIARFAIDDPLAQETTSAKVFLAVYPAPLQWPCSYCGWSHCSVPQRRESVLTRAAIRSPVCRIRLHTDTPRGWQPERY